MSYFLKSHCNFLWSLIRHHKLSYSLYAIGLQFLTTICHQHHLFIVCWCEKMKVPLPSSSSCQVRLGLSSCRRARPYGKTTHRWVVDGDQQQHACSDSKQTWCIGGWSIVSSDMARVSGWWAGEGMAWRMSSISTCAQMASGHNVAMLVGVDDKQLQVAWSDRVRRRAQADDER
jgi:hypothetical protein